MSEEKVRELAAAVDPKSQGIVQGFRQVVEQFESDLSGLKLRQAAQEGIKAGALTTASTIQQMMHPIKKAVEAEQMSVEEAKLRRDVVLAAKEIAEKVAQQAESEMLMLKGEARGLAHQLATVKKLWQGTVDGSRRKLEMSDEMESERQDRAARRASKQATDGKGPARPAKGRKGKGRLRVGVEAKEGAQGQAEALAQGSPGDAHS